MAKKKKSNNKKKAEKLTRAEIIAKKREAVENFTNHVKSELCDKLVNKEPYFVEILELHAQFGLEAQLEKAGKLKGRLYIHNPSRRRLGKDFGIVTKYKRQENDTTLVHFYTKAAK